MKRLFKDQYKYFPVNSMKSNWGGFHDAQKLGAKPFRLYAKLLRTANVFMKSTPGYNQPSLCNGLHVEK